MNKKVVNILVFSLGVVLLLLRPYAVYQLTCRGEFAKDPAKAWSLLQRLVKKKDDLHGQEESPLTNERSSSFSFRPIAKLLMALTGFLSIFLIWPACFKSSLREAIICAYPQRHRYRLVSCFLIWCFWMLFLSNRQSNPPCTLFSFTQIKPIKYILHHEKSFITSKN